MDNQEIEIVEKITLELDPVELDYIRQALFIASRQVKRDHEAYTLLSLSFSLLSRASEGATTGGNLQGG